MEVQLTSTTNRRIYNMRFLCCLSSDHKRPSDNQNQKQSPSYNGLRTTATQPVPALKPVELPQIYPDHSFPDYGWTIVVPHIELLNSYQALLEVSKTFFDLPMGEKEVFKTKRGSEGGWNYVEGEKEFITLRSLETTPELMRDAAAT
jgi:hypothetical protein